jgi:hypothetical protein
MAPPSLKSNGDLGEIAFGRRWSPLCLAKMARRVRRAIFESHCFVTISRAGDGTRTHDVQLGKLAFYQLNYARVHGKYGSARPAATQRDYDI